MGIFLLAMGTALMERADFGMSMVVAPAYLLHLYLSPGIPFFSFGMAEYLLQAVLLLLCALFLGHFRLIYLGSFVTALLYGLVLDQMLLAAKLLPALSFGGRLVCFLAGMLLGALGIAFFFHTRLPPEAYELLVKELVSCYGLPIGRVKTIYDCLSCLLAIGMSFCFFWLWPFLRRQAGDGLLCRGKRKPDRMVQ